LRRLSGVQHRPCTPKTHLEQDNPIKQFVALVGEPTAGKSMLINLVTRTFLLGLTALIYCDTANAQGVRAFAGNSDDCFISRQIGVGNISAGRREGIGESIATNVAQAVLTGTFSTLGKYLGEAASATSSAVMVAVTDVDLFRLAKKPGDTEARIELNIECLVVVSGDFGMIDQDHLPPGFADRASALDPDQMFVKRTDGQPETSLLRKLGLLDIPRSYVEFRIQRHGSASVMRLLPKYLYFRQANAAANAQDFKNIEIVATFATPSTTGTLDVNRAAGAAGTFVQLPVVISHVKPGLIKRVVVPETNIQTVWVAEPPSPNDAKREASAVNGVITFWPNNVFVTYRETDKPNLMLEVLSSFFTAASK
jgi:hypothetical protein